MHLNMKTGRLPAVIAGAVVAATCFAASARADVVGDLTCNIAAGEGQLIASQRPVSCVFHSPGPTQLYQGVISRLGVDIGNQTSAVLTYNVVALGVPGPGALAGDYIGPGFGLSLGAGGGLNALVGGGNSFVLQPIAGTTSTGVNFNAGVGQLHLTFAGLERGPRLRRYHHHRRHHGVRARRH